MFRVYDLGTPSLWSSCGVVVHVIDMNDNPPQFLETSYSVTVPEDIVAGTPILTVRATDRDGSQPNNDIIYRSFIYIVCSD